MIKNCLKEGVLWYSFSDSSGGVFFHLKTGETLSVSISTLELLEQLESYSTLSQLEKGETVIYSLISKNIFKEPIVSLNHES
jgi:hypothetical protein